MRELNFFTTIQLNSDIVSGLFLFFGIIYIYFLKNTSFVEKNMQMQLVKDLNNRWFGKRPIYAELSPVSEFEDASYRPHEMG